MKYRDLIKLLEQDGWYLKRTSSSHLVFDHPAKPGIIVVAAGGKQNRDIPTGTLNKILRDAGLKTR